MSKVTETIEALYDFWQPPPGGEWSHEDGEFHLYRLWFWGDDRFSVQLGVRIQEHDDGGWYAQCMISQIDMRQSIPRTNVVMLPAISSVHYEPLGAARDIRWRALMLEQVLSGEPHYDLAADCQNFASEVLTQLDDVEVEPGSKSEKILESLQIRAVEMGGTVGDDDD